MRTAEIPLESEPENAITEIIKGETCAKGVPRLIYYGARKRAPVGWRWTNY